jgi:hypothetical protein
MKAFQIKYRRVGPTGEGESIKGGSRNLSKKEHKLRRRAWNGPRNKNLKGNAKRIARLGFDAAVKHTLA